MPNLIITNLIILILIFFFLKAFAKRKGLLCFVETKINIFSLILKASANP